MDVGDLRLIEEFLHGDRKAVERIERWLAQAARGFRSRLRLPWEDVQQELLLKVTDLLRRGEFRGEARLRTYLWRVASYTCLNLVRDQARLQRIELEGDDPERWPAVGGSSLDRLLQSETVDGLARLMAAMPPACRELWGRILRGESYRAMSRSLGVSPGALRVRVLRCRRRALALWSGSARTSEVRESPTLKALDGDPAGAANRDGS